MSFRVPEIQELRALINTQLDAVDAAQTQLDELAAVHKLWNLVGTLRGGLIWAASEAGYNGSEIARAAGGMTKEAINKMLRRTRRAHPEPDRPAAP